MVFDNYQCSLLEFWMIAGRRYDTFISFQAEEWLWFTKAVQANTKIGVFGYFHFNPITEKKLDLARRAFNFPLEAGSQDVHRSSQYLAALTPLGIQPPDNLQMELGYTGEDRSTATALLQSLGIGPTERYVVIVPMSTWTTRNWPAARYAQLADRIVKDQDVRIVLIGHGDQQLRTIESIAAQMTATPVIAAGKTTFRQMAAVFAGAELYIGGDCGPLHVSAAVGTPFVAIFGGTSIRQLAPISGAGVCLSANVSCSPCGVPDCRNVNSPLVCLDRISVERVFDAVRVAMPRQATGAV